METTAGITSTIRRAEKIAALRRRKRHRTSHVLNIFKKERG